MVPARTAEGVGENPDGLQQHLRVVARGLARGGACTREKGVGGRAGGYTFERRGIIPRGRARERVDIGAAPRRGRDAPSKFQMGSSSMLVGTLVNVRVLQLKRERGTESERQRAQTKSAHSLQEFSRTQQRHTVPRSRGQGLTACRSQTRRSRRTRPEEGGSRAGGRGQWLPPRNPADPARARWGAEYGDVLAPPAVAGAAHESRCSPG